MIPSAQRPGSMMIYLAMIFMCICVGQLAKPVGAAKKEKVCPPLPFATLEHGRILAVAGKQRFKFECEEGFFLAGREEVRCWRGEWTSDRQPKCHKSEGLCEDPPTISNGDILGDDRNVGATVQYMCRPGFILLGGDRRSCTAAAEWSGIPPACLDEKEPLQNIAKRLDKQFVDKMGSFTSDSVGRARLLDSASTRSGLDLVVLLDRSSSVDPVDFETGKDFVKFLFEEFGIRNGRNNTSGTKAAVLAFGSKVDIVFNLDDASIEDRFAAARTLDEVQPDGGGTAMEPALTSVILHVQPLLRRRSKKALFLITDGEPNIGTPGITPEDIANNLKEHFDFEIFTIGIGKEVNRQLLSRIASPPLLSHVFVLDQYADLQSIMGLIRDRPTEAPPISPEKCGYIDDSKPKPKNWPWVAAIYIALPKPQSVNEENDTTTGNTNFVLCGGTLVCRQWVLTSASCFYHPTNSSILMNSQELFVVLGEDDLTKADENQTNFYSTETILHPNFDPTNILHHNLALVKLNVPAPAEKYRPACLPITDKTVPLHLDLNINTSIAGWGLPQLKEQMIEINGGTARLQQTTRVVTLAEEEECRRFNAGAPQDTFCAGFGSVSTCVGDPGSGIIAVDPSTALNHVLGVLSKRSECHLGYSQYTELSKYVRWISDVTDACHLAHSV